MRRLLLLVILCVVYAVQVFAGTNNYGTAGTYTNLNALPDLSRFLGIGNAPSSGSHGEDANRYKELFGGQGSVYSGGIHSTSGSCVAGSMDVIAYTNTGNRVAKTGTGIDYSTQGCNCSNPGSDEATVIASGVQNASIGNFVRVSGTPYFVNCTDAPGVAIPDDSVLLMQTTITNGQISAVTDLRPLVWHPTDLSLTNLHGTSNVLSEVQRILNDVVAPFIVSGCIPGSSGTTTTGAFACAVHLRDTTNKLVYVNQVSATVGPLSGGNGVYWIAVHKDRSTSVSGWTRQPTTHYLWLKSASVPAAPDGGMLLASVTVGSGAITAVSRVAPQRPITLQSLLHWHDIRDYGAVCDGGTDDYPAIRRAADAAEAVAGGGVIYIPPTGDSAYCLMESTLVLTKNGTSLLGAGRRSSTLFKTTTGDVLQVGDGADFNKGRDITIRDLNLQHSGSSGWAIHADHGYNLSLSDLNISTASADGAIKLVDAISVTVAHAVIGMSAANNTQSSAIRHPVGLFNGSGANGTLWLGNRVDGTTQSGAQQGTGGINASGIAVSFINNILETLYDGLKIVGGRGIYIANNYFELIDNIPIDLTQATRFSPTIINNTFTPGNGNADADIVCTTGVTHGLVVMGNHHQSTHTSGAPIRVDANCDFAHIAIQDYNSGDTTALSGTLSANSFAQLAGRLLFGSGDTTGMATTGSLSVTEIKYRNILTPASSGAGSVKMGSANAANNAGWFHIVDANGNKIYIPYWTTATP